MKAKYENVAILGHWHQQKNIYHQIGKYLLPAFPTEAQTGLEL